MAPGPSTTFLKGQMISAVQPPLAIATSANPYSLLFASAYGTSITKWPGVTLVTCRMLDDPIRYLDPIPTQEKGLKLTNGINNITHIPKKSSYIFPHETD